MNLDWRDNPATKEQKEKLRFFGCTWDEGITAVQANDALEECAKQFPDAEADYQKSQPATEKQKDRLRFFGCTWQGNITVGMANEYLAKCAELFPGRQIEADKWFGRLDKYEEKQRALKVETIPSKPEDILESRLNYIERGGHANDPAWQKWARQTTPTREPDKVTPIAPKPVGVIETPSQYLERTGRAHDPAWQRWAKAKQNPPPEVTIQKAQAAASTPAIMFCSVCRKSKTIEHNGRQWCPTCGKFVKPLYAVTPPASIPATAELVTYEKARQMGESKCKEPESPIYLNYPVEPRPGSFSGSSFDSAHAIWKIEFQQTETENRRRYEQYLEQVKKWNRRTDFEGVIPMIRREPFPEPPKRQDQNRPKSKVGDNLKSTIEELPAIIPATAEQIAEIRSFGSYAPQGLTFQEAKKWIEQCRFLYPTKSQNVNFKEVTIQQAEKNAGPAEKLEIPPVPIQPTPEQLAALNSADKYVRMRAISDLRQSKSPFAVKPLIEKLADADESVRGQAAQSLGELKSPDAVAPLIALLKDRDVYVRKHAIEALGQIGDARALDALIAVGKKTNKKLQEAATEALKRIGKNEIESNGWAEWLALNQRLSERQVRSSPQEVSIERTGAGTNGARISEKETAICQLCGWSRGKCCCADGGHFLKPTVAPAPEKFPLNMANAAAIANASPQDYTIPDREVQSFAQRQPAIRKPTSCKSTIGDFAQWVDGLTKRNQTVAGGHWLPAGPLSYHFEALTIGTSRQLADIIESRGCCVEPDARFGGGTYDRNQTLALFKPLGGDSIRPSTAYLGAANLLRLCILIATADGKLDIVELDVFRRAIENQPGLTLTDHKRLLILEQLLAQELCLASKTTAKIAKSVSPDKRLVIGKLLVEVAAANFFITGGERRVLRKIFKSFEIPPETLEKLAAQICPSRWQRPGQRPDSDDVSRRDKWLWNHWRTGHPGVVIDDTTLAEKTWNFNDWKALNARWRDLQNQLVARQKLPIKFSEGIIQKANMDAGGEQDQASKKHLWKFGFCKCCENEDAVLSRSPSGEVRSYCINCEREIKQRVFDQKSDRWIKPGLATQKVSNATPIPAPREFALDMARVYEITSETKEVVAILSVLMEDETEKSIAPSATITLPALEHPKVSGDGNATPQATRFNGLDAAFHPILERLLARDSWPKNDFKSLADEFHFMPSKIHDTLNEWAEEALGDFILDGEDPVVIRRELIGKEKVYG